MKPGAMVEITWLAAASCLKVKPDWDWEEVSWSPDFMWESW
jgi:hypothetical protein